MIREIKLNNKTVQYDLQRKKVKNINIRVKKDLTVHVSADSRVPLAYIEDLLRQKADFILSALGKYESSLRTLTSQPTFNDGNVLTVLGHQKPLRVLQGKQNGVKDDGDYILLTVKDTENTELKRKTLQKHLDILCEATISRLCQAIYPDFSVVCPQYPEIRFRHMKSRWGSCQYKKMILTFNYALIHASEECIEYVVYHEFTHFIHPNHSADFYKALSRHVPDYKRIKKRLNAYPTALILSEQPL